MKSRENLVRLKRFQVNEKRRQMLQLDMMIAEFDRMANELELQIAAEEKKSGITDVNHFAYPTFAKAARVRRDNLKNSQADLAHQKKSAESLLAEAEAELSKAEMLEIARPQAARSRRQSRRHDRLNTARDRMAGRLATRIADLRRILRLTTPALTSSAARCVRARSAQRPSAGSLADSARHKPVALPARAMSASASSVCRADVPARQGGCSAVFPRRPSPTARLR